MILTREELELPEARGIRLVALSLLDDVSASATRLASSRKSRDLHDFRVALRKLRSWLRAFNDDLPGLRKANSRQLKACAVATNSKRDQDVQLKWLARAARGLSRRRRRGSRWLINHVDRQVAGPGKKRGVDIPPDLAKVLDSLFSRLSTYRQPVRASENTGLTLAQAISSRLMPHTWLLCQALDNIETVAEQGACHQARIIAKRLRYLLEPAAPRVRGGQAAVEKLRALQNALGTLRDLQILMLRVEETLHGSAASMAGLNQSPFRPCSRRSRVPRAPLTFLR